MHGQEPNVLILYASYGDGHYQATKALQKSLHERGIHQVKMLDLMAEAHPKLNTLTRFVYMQSYRTIPGLYGLVYNMTKDMKSDKPFAHILHAFGTRRLEEYLKTERPDVVVHTFPQMVMPKLRRKIGLDIPIVNVVTDFDLHGRWLHPDVDRFYVATEEMRQEASVIGIDPKRITVSGIPIKEGFDGTSISREAQDRSISIRPVDSIASESANVKATHEFAAARALRTGEASVSGIALNPARKTVLLMAGAYGVMLGLRRVCDLLLAQGDVQVIVVCGHNEEMRAGLAQQYASSEQIQVLGFTNQVASLMRMSDCIVTKPGGITLAESLACRLPIFLFRPVPGQERNNAVYLEKQGAAFISRNAEELATQISSLLSDPAKLRAAQDRAGQLGRPDASSFIADDLISLYLTPQSQESADIPG
ncbi:glycosyltransferase [Saccharibacillus sp. JS10]|uniref:MGDG synthase family glycosyltransferase n=1 Tax=Saccharibacillus sp. JS10 TaxID=2950552 RepID=UPI00210E2CFB|nr:glycosyltransferase [Saccharibacillus sp. JS10]MCQ4087357.1 glycosyltransferase [Saccharibacillus sp. JS10]